MGEIKEALRFTAGEAITALVKGMRYYLDAGRVDDIVREAVTLGHTQYVEEKRRDDLPECCRACGSLCHLGGHCD
jgi:hypothetical protein